MNLSVRIQQRAINNEDANRILAATASKCVPVASSHDYKLKQHIGQTKTTDSNQFHQHTLLYRR